MSVSIEDVANKFFDYVIIGGGTTGLTLAARLSEDSTRSVLVLEAGGANLEDINILRPASYGSHFGNDTYTWDYQTIQQKSSGQRQVPWQRGRGLGGSSAINFMCWTKPPARDVDDFEKLGNPGWNWGNFEKYLARSEGFVEPAEAARARYNLNFDTWKIGREGPLTLAFPPTLSDSELKIRETLLNSGLSVARHGLSGNPDGVFFAPNTYDPQTHTRSYATTAFWLPNRERPNLKVLVHAAVHRVLMERTRNGQLSAIGVEFQHGNATYVVNATEEVILSAGALQSPHVLELSGIGKREVLNRAGIPCRLDLSGVGENVQDHTFIGLSWELRDDAPYDTLDLLRDPVVAARHLELHANGTGLFTTGIVGFAFATLDKVTPTAESIYQSIKDIVAKMEALPFTAPPGLLEQYKAALERFTPGNGSPGCEFIGFSGLLSQPNPPVAGKRYVSIIVAMNHPFSRGTIHSTSNDPTKDPDFDARYFEQSIDFDITVEMVKFARNLANIEPLKSMIAKEHNPGPEVQKDEELKDWIKATFNSTWHTAGSCSMLPREKGGVVDPALKVYGTNNIRVVDLSVVPLHFASHPQSAAYAIAEQAADIIKGKFAA